MTIRTTSRVAGPFAAGATTLPFAFKAFAETDMRVTRSDAAGNTSILTYGVHYTVTLNSDQEASPGGRINLYVAIPFGYTCSVTTAMPALQTLALTNQGGFFPNAINDAFDKLVILIQQMGGFGGGGGGGGGGGDITNGANVGTGAAIFSGKSGSSLLFKTLKAGVGVTLVPGADDITINASGGGSTTASNAGTGFGVFRSKTGDDLAFKSIKAGAGVTITSGADDLTINSSGGGGSPLFLSVKDFGAVGDGVADDSAAVASALNAARTQKKTLWFPDGTYLIPSLPSQNGRVYLQGTGRSILKGTFTYFENNFPISASIPVGLTPDAPYFSAVGMSFQSNTTDFALKVSTVYQGGFITTMNLERCKFYGSNGLLCQHLAGFDIHACEFNNALGGARFEGCVNGNMVQTRWQNQAAYGVYITENAANNTRKGGENLRFTNCEFDVCSYGLRVEQHMWLVVESCLMDYCILPVYLKGSWFAKIEKTYMGASDVARQNDSLGTVVGRDFPSYSGIALLGQNIAANGIPVSVTCSNCEFISYIGGTQPVVYIDGYGTPAQEIMAYESTFTECMFYMTQPHTAPQILAISYSRGARVINNRFISFNISTSMTDAYVTQNCADYYNHSNDFAVCQQSSAVLRSRYEREVGARLDGVDPGPLGIGALWSPNGSGLKVRNDTNTGWQDIFGSSPSSGKTKIVFVGDSLSAQQGLLSTAVPELVGKLLNASGAAVEVINIAKNGWNFYNANTVAMFGSQTMRDKLIALAPDIVHVHLGFNDSLTNNNSRTLAQTQADALAFFTAVRAALPGCKIFYGSQLAYDSANGTLGSLKNKQVTPYFFQLKASGILAGCYTSEILEDSISAANQTAFSNWNSLDAYIKGLSQVNASYKVPLWKCARLGLVGYDTIHLTQEGQQLCAGAVRTAYKNNATMAAALPNLSNQDYDSFNDPDFLFGQHFTNSGGNWVENAASAARDHPTNQLGPWRSVAPGAWHMPSKGDIIYNVTTVSATIGDTFAWNARGLQPNSGVSVSVDGGAFTALGVSTNGRGDYIGAGSILNSSVGTHAVRYKVGNEVHGPINLTITAGSPAPAVPELYRSTGSPSSYAMPVGNTKYYFRPASTQDNTGSMVSDVTASSQRRVQVAASGTARAVTLEASIVIDVINNISVHVLLGFDVFDISNTLLESYVVDSKYCNVINQAVTVNGSYTIPHTTARRYAPWVMTAGGFGTLLGTTPNGATSLFNVAIR